MKKKLQFLVVSALLWGGAATAQAEIYSGDCSDPYPLHGKANVTWTLDTETGVLEISGTGSMEDYDNYNNYAPWDELQSFITSVTIGEGVTHIGWHAFSGCTGLMSATISSSVTSIGEYAFDECSGLTSITIPNSVISIGFHAFDNCTGLTSVTIGNSVTTIDDRAFYGCTGLTSVTIPERVTSIGESAFYGCSGLRSVTIPASVTTIGERAFCRCTNLTEFKGKLASFDKRCLVINGTLVAFASSGLPEYTIPDNVKVIDEYAFYYCESLETVTISSSVTSIGDWAFSSCGKLRSVTIPASVTTIGERAFWGDRLTTVVAYNPTPVDIAEKNVFHEDGYYYSYFVDCTLYVPAESVEAYGAAEGWKCKTILPIDESSAITETRQDNADGHVTVYNLQGVPVLETDDAADLKMLQNGAYIVNGKTMIIAR